MSVCKRNKDGAAAPGGASDPDKEEKDRKPLAKLRPELLPYGKNALARGGVEACAVEEVLPAAHFGEHGQPGLEGLNRTTETDLIEGQMEYRT